LEKKFGISSRISHEKKGYVPQKRGGAKNVNAYFHVTLAEPALTYATLRFVISICEARLWNNTNMSVFRTKCIR
jgi:hypothetical protein